MSSDKIAGRFRATAPPAHRRTIRRKRYTTDTIFPRGVGSSSNKGRIPPRGTGDLSNYVGIMQFLEQAFF